MAEDCTQCPFCGVCASYFIIERHVQDHLEEDELATDRQLAQQMVSTSESPQRLAVNKLPGELTLSNLDRNLQNISIPKTIFEILEGEQFHHQVSLLVECQTKSEFYKVEEGLMNLLRRCLEAEYGVSQSVISGHVDHFQSIRSEDQGWGCGWRNIQMLSSHILMQPNDAREILFGGAGVVPDIASLQRWLEIAWHRGFDAMGAQAFNFNIYGSKKWIGTTECAALLRSFGLRARIVDFGCEAVKKRSYSCHNLNQGVTRHSKGMQDGKRISGPLDKYFCSQIVCDGCNMLLLKGVVYISFEKESFHLCPKCIGTGQFSYSDFVESEIGYSNESACDVQTNNSKKCNNHQVLAEWVWNYFTGEKISTSGLKKLNSRVSTSHKTPLYFQHQGHSRTIVGVQRRIKPGRNTTDEEVFLLVLDPAQRTNELVTAFKRNVGWQKLMKRGLHTLRKPEYQLCYVDPGIAHGRELELLKVLDSEVHKY